MDWYAELVSTAGEIDAGNRDKFCQIFVDNEPKDVSDVNTLKTLLKAAQSLLKLKIEQVERLELELDDLFTKDRDEDSEFYQQNVPKLAQAERAPVIDKNGSESEDDLQQSLLASELRAEKLLLELQAQEQEQLANKMEMERLVDQVSTLENERSQLKREVLALREEMREQRRDLHPVSEDTQKKHQQLTDLLRQKNKHISQLLKDLEAIEKENLTLREKLTTVKTELVEATENINHTTSEMAALQLTKKEQADLILELQQMCEALRNQVKDLVFDKEKRDAELEIFDRDIDLRVQEFKKLLEEKDKELTLLYEKLSNQTLQGQVIASESESSRIALLSQTLQNRENQIEELQTQLSQATKDLIESTSLLEKLQTSSQSKDMTDIGTTQKIVESSEEQIKHLKLKLQEAEKDSEEKSEDITQLIIQLRRYEAGEFGLTEAVCQIKELSQQKQLRDKHIEELIDNVNLLKSTCDSLEEQNLVLRDRLGMPPDEQIFINKAALKQEEQQRFQIQNEKIDCLEEELVELKMERRKLSQQVLMLCKKLQDSEPHPHQSQKGTAFKLLTRAQADSRSALRKIRKLQKEQEKWEIERQSFIQENEALRQGLHEILDSVHKQDGQSNVLVESKGLENLLQALDSRHVSGWYHPAMRLQAQVNTLEGNNASLRDQLRRSRDNVAKVQGELLKAKMIIAKIEQPVEGHQPDAFDQSITVGNKEDIVLTYSEDPAVSVTDVIYKLNRHLLQVLNEYEIEKSHVATLVSIQKELQQELDVLVSQLANSCQLQKEEKDRWDEERLHHQEQLDQLHAQLSASEAQVAQLSSSLKSFTSKDTQSDPSACNVLQTAAIIAEKEFFERKANSAIRLADMAKGQLKQTKNECNSVRNKMFHRFGEIIHFKKFYIMYLSELETLLANSASMESLESANKRANEITAQYTHSLRKQEIQMTNINREMKSLMSELQLEKQEKFELFTQLENAHRKLQISNIVGDPEKEKTVFLAAAEARESSEKQRASHAEKMADFAKAELKQVTERCSALEQEISMLLSLNHELKMKLSCLDEQCSKMITPDQRDELETQLAHAKAEVIELQASREQLQELTDIAQDQINILDHLHDNCEVQLDSLRQTVYELQSESDQASLIARLNEDLCASQLSEMSAQNHVKSLEAEVHRLQALCDFRGRAIDELHQDLNKQKLHSIESSRALTRRLSELQERFTGTLPLPFYQTTVQNFIECSVECQDLWHKLQEVQDELNEKLIVEEQNKIICHQSLELKNSLLPLHSDTDCQKNLESWMAKLTDITLKELKSTRRCEALEAQMKQTEQRLAKQEHLIATLEHQLLSFQVQEVLVPYNIVEQGIDDDQKEIGNSDPIQYVHVSQGSPMEKDNQQPTSPSHIKPFPLQFETEPSDHKRNQVDNNKLQAQIVALKDEVRNLTEALDKRMEELHAYNTMIAEMQQIHSDSEKKLRSKCDELEQSLSFRSPLDNSKSEYESDESRLHNKSALQATVNSLQNIIYQKEETICRYQSLLQDVREEDARIISALQDRLHNLQVDLSAQEQAYVRLKNSLRQQSLDGNSGASSKSALDAQLTRTNELEDEVALLSTKVASLTAELLTAQKESRHWSSIAKQRLLALEEANQSPAIQDEKGAQQEESHVQLKKNASFPNISSAPSSQSSCPIDLEYAKRSGSVIDGSSKPFEKLVRGRVMQLHLHLSEEVAVLRSKLQAMEESERQSKKEIQRLRDQIPIYSRRTQRPQNDNVLSEKEAELMKKTQELQDQILKLKSETERSEILQAQQEFKKIKSAENVARWEEKKKNQNQIEKMKSRLQEQADEITLLSDKIGRMHSTIHRLEREKIALESQLKNSLERERTKFEHELKAAKENEETQCILEEMRHDRDKLRAEITLLKSKVMADCHDRRDFCNEKIRQENASLLRSNLALECQNLELKLEFEKMRANTSCLSRKANEVEPPGIEQQASVVCSPNINSKGVEVSPSKLQAENRKLRVQCQDLQTQLEHANSQVNKLETTLDGSKNASLVSELQQKTQLLSKVKVLLERAAMKERALSQQVSNLEEVIARQS